MDDCKHILMVTVVCSMYMHCVVILLQYMRLGNDIKYASFATYITEIAVQQ